MERVGLYPGTFDPITKGHADIIRRARQLVDHLIIGVAINRDKGPLFSLEERVSMIEEEIVDNAEPGAGRVSVQPFEGLLVQCARDVGASHIIKGLRAVSDFEYEFAMADMNSKLDSGIATIFLMANGEHQAIASKLVKEIARLDGDVSAFVSKKVQARLQARVAEL